MTLHYSSRLVAPALSVLFIFMMFFTIGDVCRLHGGGSADNVAIKGYDPVAYFREGRAVRGDSAFSFRWHDMNWHFSSKENRDLFAESPVMYAPQYDGYCAWAMTESRRAVTDPEVWKIVNCRLYLNCSRTAFEKWSRDIPGNIKKADANWKRLSQGK